MEQSEHEDEILKSEIISNSFDFFSKPALGISEEESHFIKISPNTSLDNEAPIIYDFDTDYSKYADLSQMFHFVQMKIVKSDNQDLGAVPDAGAGDEHKVAPICNFSNSFFENVELYLNGTLIESSNNLYPYKSYLQTLLSYDTQMKGSQLQASGFYDDDGKNIDSDGVRNTMSANNCSNKNLYKRYELSKASKSFVSLSPINLDICTQGKYIQNKTNIKIRFTRAHPKFCLIANDEAQNFKYIIERAFIMVRIVKPRESLRYAIDRSLQILEAKYPMKNVTLRYFNFPQNTATLNEPNLYSGPMPTRICLGLIESTAQAGNYKKSPFNFQPFKVQEIDLRKNGQSLTSDPLKIDVAKNDYLQPYFHLQNSIGGFLSNDSCIIPYENFKDGKFIYVFDLTSDYEHSLEQFHQPETGNLSIEIRLAEQHNQALTLIVMLEHETILTCNRDRQYSLQK